jgi:hypothetical protein
MIPNRISEGSEMSSIINMGNSTEKNSIRESKLGQTDIHPTKAYVKISPKRKANLNTAKTMVKEMHSKDKLTKLPDVLRKIEKLYENWKIFLKNDTSNIQEIHKTHQRRNTLQISHKDGANVSFNENSDLEFSVPPLATIISFLSILENTPEDSKELIKTKIFDSFISEGVNKSAQLMTQLEQKQNYDMSNLHQKSNSFSPSRHRPIYGKYL